jgi:subtilisin-like proprotein convertase family protein
VSLSLALPESAGAQTFTNATSISIPSLGAATPYPSTITVAGLSSPIGRISLTLNGLSHTFPDDLDVLLVAPDGARLIVMSDAGGLNAVTSLNITLSDSAVIPLPDSAALTSGTFRPGNFLTVADPFAGPAPAVTGADSPAPGGTATFNSQFGGHTGNGVWSLYLMDDASGDTGTISGGWTLTFAPLPSAPPQGTLLISEFRLRGPTGASDEFIEIYNNMIVSHTVNAVYGWGYGIAASDGVTRCTIPNGTVIAAGGHYLCVNSAGYSLSSYPAGNGTTATGDAAYTADIPDNVGIAIFNNNLGGGLYALANRLDAAGSTSEVNTLYKEGGGYPALTAFSIDHAWVRKKPGGCTGTWPDPYDGNCKTLTKVAGMPGPFYGVPQDTNNNLDDFIFVDTNGTDAAGGQRLGAPGPENLSSPIHRPGGIPVATLDNCTSDYSPPNTVRDFTSDPANNSTFGTLDLRRTFINTSGANLTRLRFRIIDITTFPSISGVSDLRPRSSTAVVVTVDRPPCGSGTSNVTVHGTTLEQPPSQPNGGGFNSTLSDNTVTLATPLANGASIDFRILLGIQQTGLARLCVMTETLPASQTKIYCHIGGTDTGDTILRRPRATDFNGDVTADVAVFRPGTADWYIQGVGTVQWGLPGDIPVPGDYDGDGVSDIAVFRPSNGTWYLRNINTIVWGLPGDIPVPADYNGDHITDVAVYRRSTGQWIIRNYSTVSFGGPDFIPVPGDYNGNGADDIAVFAPATANWFVMGSSGVQWGLPGDQPVQGDYDGDGDDDFAVYRPSTGTWYLRNISTVQWGLMGDIPVPRDFDANGTMDIAVYRRSTGEWFVRNQFTVQYGVSTDVPLPALVRPSVPSPRDFDGDGREDAAVFRPSTNTWYMRLSIGQFSTSTTVSWGLSGDLPVPGDFDGDGKTDPAVYRPSNGQWHWLKSSTNYASWQTVAWGLNGDVPVPADFDGDGRSDLVVYRPSNGTWYVLTSGSAFTVARTKQWGLNADLPKPGDYDGDGLADYAVYRPSTREWFVMESKTNSTTWFSRQWGLSGDVASPADFDGDGRLDMVVYRPSTGTWYVLLSLTNFTTTRNRIWGLAGDVPKPGDWDGDGLADYAVYRPSTGQWLVVLSSTNFATTLTVPWGLSTDTPLLWSDGEDVPIGN